MEKMGRKRLDHRGKERVLAKIKNKKKIKHAEKRGNLLLHIYSSEEERESKFIVIGKCIWKAWENLLDAKEIKWVSWKNESE